MARRVRGYSIPAHGGPFSWWLPQGAELLSVHPGNRGTLQLWALVDPHAPTTEERRFLLIKNGADIEVGVRFISTFTARGGVVAHLFEIIEQPD